MRPVSLHRTAAFLLAGILAPLFLTQCKTTSKSYKDISYDPSKLKTPAGHGMERNDYPFDEQGNYRKDWVKGNTTGRDRSASPGSDPATAAPAGTEAAPQGSTSYPNYAEASAARESGNFVGPAGSSGTSAETATASPAAGESTSGVELASAGTGTAASSTPSYHKVTNGDTLFSLASRYHTSVSELKRVNGLTGDSIRAGQSLRIP